ncbi:sugar phosphate isomerase/epimerase family protein [Evansella cellulosilytica]|uniref:Xylose isomerase domain-containing protein TIM barrel n=1 Tax=Evansella cellulosilytica (strain ATCC 21833 / DSM 2522 / FERM P-1141 / JCM 9156 / N-4) TaxID=649639 RepID=E6TVU8_EVAC2|nr:sugar phosphate isomerase/epimerase [Evansella cellulosilytica]ADU28657.1 Xylose isomerase domain-containing protein TIM barrel [Evansella cellulosilytica DSM 2522]
MDVGYMTNGYGLLVGAGGGVTSVKDIRYETLCEDKAVIETVASQGYSSVEMFDGNLERFANSPEQLQQILDENNVSLLGVYIGANFIYKDALEDELWRIEHISDLAAKFGAKHIVLGGGAVRPNGNTEEDYTLLANALEKAEAIVTNKGMVASYHPHLGSMVESPDQVDKLFEQSKIPFCPDIAHLAAGGGDPLSMIKKYKDRIKYIHLKDLKDGTFMPLGKGDLPITEIIEYLKSEGYEGDWLVEIDGYNGEPEEASLTSYEFLKGKLDS